MPEHLVTLLFEHKTARLIESELIFSTVDGTPLSERNVTLRHFKPCLVAAGLGRVERTEEGKERIISNFRLYDLRHTHATLLLLAGTNPKIVSERLGHSTVTLTLDTYSHVLPGMQRESASKLNALLFSGDKHDETAAYN